MSIARVSLVGAGPGDPELLTMAAVKALQTADVVLYDALVNPVILEWAEGAEKIFVGKRKGFKRYEQEEINELLVQNAIKYGHAVRLKGGDSFIFGRGAEEVDYVNTYDIPCRVIPGISSATSVPVTQGIALTKRNIAEGFWVITGTTKERQLSKDVHLAAQSSSTVVVLMGMTHLPQIVELFKTEGKHKMPIAIVQNGYRDNQRSCIGTIDSIVEDVKQHQLSHPAVIIIGEVVRDASKVASVAEQAIFENTLKKAI